MGILGAIFGIKCPGSDNFPAPSSGCPHGNRVPSGTYECADCKKERLESEGRATRAFLDSRQGELSD